MFFAGAERHASGNALQLLADSRAAPLLKALDQCACHSGRAAALRQDAVLALGDVLPDAVKE